MNLTARVLGRRPPALRPRLAVGASAISRTIGSVPEGRTWSQRSRQESRSPSRSSAAGVGEARAAAGRTAAGAPGRAVPWPSRSCTGGTRPPAATPLPQTWQGDARSRPPPAGASRPMCSAGSMTPPLPSPPITAPSSRMARATLASPTGARTSRAPRGAGRVLHHQAGRQVHHDGRRFRRSAASIQHGPDRERQRVVLADRLGPSRPPAPAGPRRDPPPGRRRRRVSRTSAPSSPRFSGTGSGAPREAAVGLQVDAAHPAAQPLEQRRDGGRAGAAHAVERDMEARGADGGDVDHRAARGPRRGAGRRPRGPRARRRSRPSPSAAGPASASARTRAPASASRKIPSGPTNLSAFHSIGLWLAVRISPAAGVVVLHRQLHRRRRHDAEVDDVHPHRHEPRRRGVGEHRPAGPRVAARGPRRPRLPRRAGSPPTSGPRRPAPRRDAPPARA